MRILLVLLMLLPCSIAKDAMVFKSGVNTNRFGAFKVARMRRMTGKLLPISPPLFRTTVAVVSRFFAPTFPRTQRFYRRWLRFRCSGRRRERRAREPQHNHCYPGTTLALFFLHSSILVLLASFFPFFLEPINHFFGTELQRSVRAHPAVFFHLRSGHCKALLAAFLHSSLTFFSRN